MNKGLIKMYERYEDANCRIFTNYIGTFLFWLFVFFSVLFAAIVGMTRPSEDDMGFLAYIYCMFNLIQMSNWQRVRYVVMEENKPQNFFVKLMYVPINLKMYFVTKTLRKVRYYILYAMLMQLLALVINLIYNGRLVLTWITFVPLISGFISTVVLVMILFLEYRRALKQV